MQAPHHRAGHERGRIAIGALPTSIGIGMQRFGTLKFCANIVFSSTRGPRIRALSVFGNVRKAIRQQERRLEDNGSNKEALSATLSQFWAQSQTSSCLRPSRMLTRSRRTVLSALM